MSQWSTIGHLWTLWPWLEAFLRWEVSAYLRGTDAIFMQWHTNIVYTDVTGRSLSCKESPLKVIAIDEICASGATKHRTDEWVVAVDNNSPSTSLLYPECSSSELNVFVTIAHSPEQFWGRVPTWIPNFGETSPFKDLIQKHQWNIHQLNGSSALTKLDSAASVSFWKDCRRVNAALSYKK